MFFNFIKEKWKKIIDLAKKNKVKFRYADISKLYVCV